MNAYIRCYRILWCVLYPFVYAFMLYRKKVGKEDIHRFAERFGLPSRLRPTGKLFWVHAASVGEALSAITLIQRLKDVVDCCFLLTTGTVSSANIIATRNIPGVIHQYIPIDYKPFVDSFFKHWKPDCGIIIESELWPNLIEQCTSSRLFLVNARLSNRSFKKWRHFGGFIRAMLQKFSLIMTQTAEDSQRYKHFADNVVYTGNLKYSTLPLVVNQELLDKLKCWRRKYVFVAASTHEGEDLQVINAYSEIVSQLGKESVSLIIIPRHPERSMRICDLVKSRGYNVVLRSKFDNDSTDVMCVDTFGEMGTFYKIATFSFVGGSLVRVGGHNIFEPVQSGCPTMFGPYMFNFTEMSEFLKQSEVAYLTENAYDIAALFCRFVTSTEFHKHVLDKLHDFHNLDPAKNIIQLLG